MAKTNNYFTAITLALICASQVEANLDYPRSQEIDVGLALPSSNYWPNIYADPNNVTSYIENSMGCAFCGEIFYNEPPPDDIIFIPSPPLHPGIKDSVIAETIKSSKQQNNDQCSFCNVFADEGEQLANSNGINRNMSNSLLLVFGSIIAITVVALLYLLVTRKPRIIPSFARTTVFKSPHEHSGNHHGHQINKNTRDTLPHPGIAEPCYLQTNREKNLTSPIISDHVSHKKTAIPSKCWAQPGSIVNRTVRRVPNEYEVPSSQTNSTGASSAFYGEMGHDHRPQGNISARFFSPYNLHTYAEVREVLDTNEHIHTSSNSSAMLSESNYDNALYPHQGNMSVQNAPNGSVQMSDFNSMRPTQSIGYQQAAHMSFHNQTLSHLHAQQSIYEQPQARAQIIITSNNQGVDQAILNHRDRTHDVI